MCKSFPCVGLKEEISVTEKRKEFLMDVLFETVGSILFGVGVYTFAAKG